MIHRISGNTDKDFDELVIKTLKSEMNIDMKIEQIDRTHRIGSFKKDSGNRKSRPIIVKFARYADKPNVFVNKKVSKGKNISITESVNKKRVSKLKEAKEQYGFKREWTIDGKFYLKKMIALLLSLKFIMSKVSGYYVPFVEL